MLIGFQKWIPTTAHVKWIFLISFNFSLSSLIVSLDGRRRKRMKARAIVRSFYCKGDCGERGCCNWPPTQAGEGVKLEETQAPPFVAAMEGKTYIFQVRVSSYNFKANHQTLTISWCKTGRGEAFKKGGCWDRKESHRRIRRPEREQSVKLQWERERSC